MSSEDSTVGRATLRQSLLAKRPMPTGRFKCGQYPYTPGNLAAAHLYALFAVEWIFLAEESDEFIAEQQLGPITSIDEVSANGATPSKGVGAVTRVLGSLSLAGEGVALKRQSFAWDARVRKPLVERDAAALHKVLVDATMELPEKDVGGMADESLTIEYEGSQRVRKYGVIVEDDGHERLVTQCFMHWIDLLVDRRKEYATHRLAKVIADGHDALEFGYDQWLAWLTHARQLVRDEAAARGGDCRWAKSPGNSDAEDAGVL